MIIEKKIQIGSFAFFKGLHKYIQSDMDWICITDSFFPNQNVANVKIKENDIFLCRNMSKDEFIQDTIDSNVPMRVGKFLVPEFCEYIGFEISDYDKLSDMFDNLDEKHRYEIIIRDAYIENNGFFLTDEQRLKAYEEYKRERPDRYSQT